MWPTISDMSRDECRKCLRCLELDAYGNMVSVLRAQGPLTDEKRKLLEELAKILHISNERHRAEIRRAVNDEKLSVIAEQLNGPNTNTDWAIEGRRTIPLLPRLKAHTAFTGLANSLSLVLAAANEKKRAASNKIQDTIVKNETVSHEDAVRKEQSVEKVSVLHKEVKTRGRKRKISSPLSRDNASRKAQCTETNVNETETNSVVEERVASPVLAEEKLSTNVVQVSIVTPSSTVDNESARSNNENTLDEASTNVENHHNFIIDSVINRDNEEDSLANNLVVGPSSRGDISRDINGQESVNAQCNVKIIDEESRKDGPAKDETRSVEETKVSRPDSTTSTPCPKRLITTNFCVTTKPVITSSTNCVVTVNSGSTTSCGPGPPSVTPSATLSYKKIPPDTLNDQSPTKMGIALNSNKTLKINAHPNARLATKANVIVVKKGSSRGVTLSHGGKEALGKVIIGGKNLCLASQKGNAAIKLLPRRVGASNNGEQTLETINHENSVKFGSRTNNVIMLGIQQDVLDQNPVLSQCLEASGTTTSSAPNAALKTSKVRDSNDNNQEDDHLRSKVSEKSTKSASPVNGLHTELNEKMDIVSEDCSIYSIVGNTNSSNSTENTENLETIDGDSIKTRNALDTESENYNYEANDGIVIEDHIEESIETTGIDIFSTSLDSPSLNLGSVQYVTEEEDQEIVIESRERVIGDSPFCETPEHLDDLSGDS